MLAMFGENRVVIIEMKEPRTLIANCICLNIYSIVACELVERLYISISIKHVAVVEVGTN